MKNLASSKQVKQFKKRVLKQQNNFTILCDYVLIAPSY